jgi:small conductance mechanosensitive channel
MDEQLRTLDKVTDMALEMAVRFGPKVLVATLILVAGYIAGGWAARAMARPLRRFHLEPPVQSLVLRGVRLVVLGLFLVMALQNLGVELLPLIAGLGVAGAGIALAMQGVLSNVVAGLTIIFSKPFRVGDYISIVNEEGTVEDIRTSASRAPRSAMPTCRGS